ncbi:hypothetical protein [Hyphomicrobium sp. 2TAF46]|uniref:hypothetical protein n=1 Tax=Hyphomicrobium sp. 2TAF46 TaxID=3233019 RepID=UPI003F8F0F1A
MTQDQVMPSSPTESHEGEIRSGADIALGCLDVVSSAYLVAGGALIAACTAFAAQVWDYPFPRGCMLLVVRNSVFAVLIAGFAWIYGRIALTVLSRYLQRCLVFNSLLAIILIAMSSYELFVKNFAPGKQFTSCFLAWPLDDACNYKTESISKKDQLRLSQFMLELQASPWSSDFEVEFTTKKNASQGTASPPL